MKYTTIDKILSRKEFQKAYGMYTDGTGNFHKRVKTEIIEPNMDRINMTLGQENDPDYIAYMVEAAMEHAVKVMGKIQ